MGGCSSASTGHHKGASGHIIDVEIVGAVLTIKGFGISATRSNTTGG